MRPSELLDPADVVLDFRPTDKWQAIGDLVHHLVALGKLPAELEGRCATPSSTASVPCRREWSGASRSRTQPWKEVTELLAVMGVVQDGSGLDFESIDGQGARVVVLLVIPKGQKLLHIRTLADIARVLTKESVRAKLMETRDQAEAHAVLVAGEA